MPSEYEKFYKILDLNVGASKEEVKKSFRELSQMYHPDNYARKSPEVQKRSEDKFKELSNAYHILKDFLSEEDSSREAEEKTKAEQDRKNRTAENRRKAEQDRRDKEEQSRKKSEKNRREEEVKEKNHWEEQAKKKYEEEKRRENKAVQFSTNCPICKESITINSTLSQSKTKIHFEVFCEFCKGTYIYFFQDGVPIFSSGSKESSKEYSSQKNGNGWEDAISVSIRAILRKPLDYFIIFFVAMFVIDVFIDFMSPPKMTLREPNDHSNNSSTEKFLKGNHLSESKLNNIIHTVIPHSANIRSKPSIKSKVIGLVKQGMNIVVIESNASWSKVHVFEKTG